MSFCGSRQNVSLRGSVPRERQQWLALELTLPALSPHSRRSSNRNYVTVTTYLMNVVIHPRRTQAARICRRAGGSSCRLCRGVKI